jgi:phosphonopyruvate decarboxylase
MIECKKLFQIFDKNDLTFYIGVPDSTFKHWMTFLDDHHGKGLTNIIAANECEAIAIASGYHLATGKTPVAYMQNSGLGKTINPLTSLCDPEVYSIGVLLMVGWRGIPGIKDEPQHKKMGRITKSLLDTLEIPYDELPESERKIEGVVSKAISYIKKKNAAYGLIIKPGMIGKHTSSKNKKSGYKLSREAAIQTILDNLNGQEVILSTTGKASRELFENRTKRTEHPRDFYTVGSMGCVASIALGIALQKPNRPVLVFDGDGSIIMQMGTLATIGYYKPSNLYHFVFDNGCYESTGGQPTVSGSLDFAKIAMASGYVSAETITSHDELNHAIKKTKGEKGPCLIVVKVNTSSRKDLGRPTSSPIENKEAFMQWMSDEK